MAAAGLTGQPMPIKGRIAATGIMGFFVIRV